MHGALQLLYILFVDAGVLLYGSSRSGIGLKSSDVNIDMKADKAAAALKLFYTTLKADTSGKALGYVQHVLLLSSVTTLNS